MFKTTTATAKCNWTDHYWVTTHHDNGSSKQKMICDKCGTRSTIGEIEATNRMLTAKRIASYRGDK